MRVILASVVGLILVALSALPGCGSGSQGGSGGTITQGSGGTTGRGAGGVSSASGGDNKATGGGSGSAMSSGGAPGVASGGTTGMGSGGMIVLGSGGSTGAISDAATSVGGAIDSGNCPPTKCVNLIKNGDFSMGTQYWEGGGIAAADGVLCETFSAGGGTGLLGWAGHANVAQAVPLTADTSYTFSYTAWTTATLDGFEAKVSHATGPYTTNFSATTDVLTDTPTLFTHTFTTTAPDTAAGVAFLMKPTSAGKTCFKNVSLVQNATGP